METTGIFEFPAAVYHSDPCERPSLSSSIAHVLVTQSPAHARAAHPRLNPDFKREDKKTWDVGTTAHALLLEGTDVAVICDYPDWRTNAAKDERDAARAAGQVPLLTKDWDEVQAMVAATHAQLDAIDVDPPLFVRGKPEQTLIWEEDGVTCRALVDWLHDDMAAIDDFKTTSRSANPETWSRTLFGIGADVQVAFYLRGLVALTDARADFRFVVQETYPPYALSVVALAPSALALANEKVDYAISTWKRCLASDEWTAYPTRVAFAEAPSWEQVRWLEREEMAA